MATGKYTRTPAHIENLKRAAFIRNGSLTPEQRFWSKVEKSDGCWEWQGQRNRKGYGELSISSKWVKAHRYSWSLVNGQIADGLFVCHRCDNPCCVRPSHLFLGTTTENQVDAAIKGRRGKRLTKAAVLAIRARSSESPFALAGVFGVSHSTIHDVIQRRTWRHVEAQ